jgi:hypothetical protein
MKNGMFFCSLKEDKRVLFATQIFILGSFHHVREENFESAY